MAKKEVTEKKEKKEKKIFVVNIRKLKTNYELRYDYNKMLTEYIKTLPKEHRSVRCDNIINADGVQKDDWVRLVREIAMGQIISFLLDNGIPFVFENVPEEDIAKLRFEYIARQKRLAEVLKLKAEKLTIDESFDFMKIQPYHYQKQAVKFFEINNGISILGDSPGVGKAQSLNSLIATPEGWVRMGDIEIGQKIFSQDGNIYSVTGVFPQGIQDTYRVIFGDDSSTECNMEHLWVVRDRNRKRRNAGWVVKSLSQLINSGIKEKNNIKRENSNRKQILKWEIPTTEPVKYPAKNFIIDPYILGALIGDGYICGETVAISIPDNQIQIRKIIDSLLPSELKTRENRHPNCPQYHITRNTSVGKNPFKEELDRLNIRVKSGKKFIPKEYLYSGINQRISLLQGLMDTDGSADKNRVNYHTSSEELAKNVVELVQSLGGRALIHIYNRKKEEKTTEYRVSIRIKNCPFRLDEKIKEWKIAVRHDTSRKIKSVEFIRREEHQCISVDSPDKTYLTNNYIVTHNTLPSFTYAAKHKYKTLIVCPASLKLNWRKEILNFTHEKAFIYKFKPKKKSKIISYKKEESLFHIINYESLETYLKIEYKHTCKGHKLVPGKGMTICGTEIIDLQKKHKECPICKNQNSFKTRIIGYQGFTDDFDEFIDPKEYDLIIIDEFHRIKEKKTGWTQIIREAFRDVIPRKLLLSGTAIKSRPSEFFIGLNFLDPKVWNNQHEFGVRYCAGFEDTFGWKYDGASNLEELYERMSPIFLRRLKKDVLSHLPPKTYTNIPIELTNEEFKDYNKLLEDCVKIKDGKEVKEGYLEKILKLKLFLAKCKLKRVEEFIQDSIDSGEKIVIMSDFQEIAESIYKKFKDNCVLHTGSINEVNKQEAVDKFQTDKNIQVFSGMIIASGVGITLTAANKLMFIGFAWTSADMEQCEDRIHRATTTHENIQIITPYCVDTIDEDIIQMLSEKEKILNKVLDNKINSDKKIETVDLNILKKLIEKLSSK